jgi:protein SCO1/2
MSISRWRAFALVLVGLAAIPATVACTGGDAAETPTGGGGFMGAVVTPPIEKPHAILTDEYGQPFDLRKETEGYVTLLFVGFTHCPDICPAHMHEISEALKQLDPAVASQIKVIFATADPERDTPEQLKQYLDTFDPNFIGLTGTREQMDQFQVSVGVRPATRTELGGGNYTVNHAAYVMAFTKDNFAYTVYPSGMGQRHWLNDLPLLVQKGFSTE